MKTQFNLKEVNNILETIVNYGKTVGSNMDALSIIQFVSDIQRNINNLNGNPVEFNLKELSILYITI